MTARLRVGVLGLHHDHVWQNLPVVASGEVGRSGCTEPGTSGEIESLEQSVAQGVWTIGRGAESILKLRALADRLGYRITEVHESSTVAPPRQVIVERGATTLAALLRALVPPSVPVMSDRGVQERRTSTRSTANDRRQQDRRRPSSTSWGALRFRVVLARRDRGTPP